MTLAFYTTESHMMYMDKGIESDLLSKRIVHCVMSIWPKSVRLAFSVSKRIAHDVYG